MADQPDRLIHDMPEASFIGDRLENFLSALFELKYSISHIEKRYPFLGNELSTICEETLARLSSPAPLGPPSVDIEPAHLPLPAKISNNISAGQSSREEILSDQHLEPEIEMPHATAGSKNPLVNSVDAAGGLLITCLDKAGDWIILAFEKLLAPGQKERKQPPIMQA